MAQHVSGRLIDHIHLVVKDLEASKRFYKAVLGALEIPLGGESEDMMWADELYVSNARGALGQLTGRIHLAFKARDVAMLERFHREAIAAGGIDNGAPGPRPQYSGKYYGAFVLDPDGNNIEATFHAGSVGTS
jgi:catechol 2,3-dioxygenase-like lactoylglutathione lyase family enzyme